MGTLLELETSANGLKASGMAVDKNNKKAVPFVKWAGGKRNVIHELTSRLPATFNDYYEPFIGGGALFFETAHKYNRAFLSDNNLELVFVYNVIKKKPGELVERLKVHARKHCKEYYYDVRSQHHLHEDIEIAARFIYLNKTCYNGLYRVNKSGEFNVPMGAYKNPNIIQEENMALCSSALKLTSIQFKDFRAIAPQKNDFVYFDPPYHPVNDTSNFTSYTKLSFTEKDQADLRDLAVKLHKKGVKVMLSNSNTKLIRELYSKSIFKVDTVKAPRYINCKPNLRNGVEEVVIVNY